MIRLEFKRPELHKFITFSAKDLYGKLLLHLDGDKTISVMPRTNCDEYIDVQITGVPGGYREVGKILGNIMKYIMDTHQD